MSESVGAGSGPAGDESRGFGAGALTLAGIVALVIGAGGGYAVGHSKGSDSGKEDGIAQGMAQEAAKYKPGKPAYAAIYDAGRSAGERQGRRVGHRRGEAEGKRVGFEQGKQVGIKDGEQEGVQTGANAALGGMGDWQNGALYVVVAENGADIPTVITQRHMMAPGNNYKLCKSDPQKLCESPIAEQ